MAAAPLMNARSVATLGQFLVIGAATIGTYSFVRVAREAEHRRVCNAPCTLEADYLGANRKAPPFTLKDMNGAAVSLESYRGKTVVLNLWSRTCPPCIKEMPQLAEFSEKIHSRTDVALLTVTTDDGPEAIRSVLQQVFEGAPPPFPILFDPDGTITREKFGTHLFPETWVIDPKGIIRARFDGPRDWSAGIVTQLVDEIGRGDYCSISIDKRIAPQPGTLTCSDVVGS